MGGFFGAVSTRDVVHDVFFGVDYHSHLGTKHAGLVFHDAKTTHATDVGFQREIHSIENSPFRTRFDADLPSFHGNSGIGCISDTNPQPLVMRSHLGVFALTTVGCINNADELVKDYLSHEGRQFTAMSSGQINTTELVAAVINHEPDFISGIKYVQQSIDGSLTLLIMTDDGTIIAARDRLGRLPVLIGRNMNGHCVSFESFAYQKLGYEDEYELGPGEIVEISANHYQTLAPAGDTMRICAFLWVYYGYPNSNYENKNVEVMRYRNGAIMAANERAHDTIPEVDYVAGIPDSGTPHAIGYAHESGIPFGRPFIKYTPTWPRSFMPTSQEVRDRVATMKQVPVSELIKNKKLLLIDDSIVRGTQLRNTVDFLYESGANKVHMRSACPPIMFGCKYLTFSRNDSIMNLIARRTIRALENNDSDTYLAEYIDASTERSHCLVQKICESIGFDGLSYQTLDGLLEAIGLPREKVCTYCWNGKE